ncbi:phenylalanine--tRNA ligase beta subunit [Elysia marginata]|uniref:Phenylalanine--tRNA ligase beta subunit n=1 Tax=Elysia marginata TaxID=1093978 RepID=A0AAV4HE63_9GAST|nr:phenylalanine--tRNA ligase beta subunit [Elysia marginata]
MRFSYKELKRLASLPEKVTIEEVAKAINSIGFEVEATFPFGDVEGIKFGKVLEVSKNPHGDKLNVCKIEFDDKTRIIQSTATNVVPGKVIIAFVPGSRAGGITFGEKKMKEIVSEGMLSSLTELGVSKDLVRDSYQEGIMFYDEVKDLSLDPVDYLDLQDTIIDVDILSNRSDAQSYYVMARELAAYFKTDFQ